METKHTQGEWEVENKTSAHGDYFVVKSNTISICNITTRNYEQSEYNAKLIAAAPNLLEALKSALASLLALTGNPTEEWEEVKQAKDAIKKATI
jgi:hypothetical protein